MQPRYAEKRRYEAGLTLQYIFVRSVDGLTSPVYCTFFVFLYNLGPD